MKDEAGALSFVPWTIMISDKLEMKRVAAMEAQAEELKQLREQVQTLTQAIQLLAEGQKAVQDKLDAMTAEPPKKAKGA